MIMEKLVNPRSTKENEEKSLTKMLKHVALSLFLLFSTPKNASAMEISGSSRGVEWVVPQKAGVGLRKFLEDFNVTPEEFGNKCNVVQAGFDMVYPEYKQIVLSATARAAFCVALTLVDLTTHKKLRNENEILSLISHGGPDLKKVFNLTKYILRKNIFSQHQIIELERHVFSR